MRLDSSRRPEADALWRVACRLAARAGSRKGSGAAWGGAGLPPLLLFTDPRRTPDPVAAALRLPPGAGVVYRHFGRADAGEVGAALAAAARRRGLTLLVGDDEALAAVIGADGVHLPQRRAAAAVPIRARRPGWLVTVAAHDARALRRAGEVGADAAVLSPAFPSRSPSAGRPLGPIRFAALVRGATTPVYALGGVSAATAPRLVHSGACGLAAVEALG